MHFVDTERLAESCPFELGCVMRCQMGIVSEPHFVNGLKGKASEHGRWLGGERMPRAVPPPRSPLLRSRTTRRTQRSSGPLCAAGGRWRSIWPPMGGTRSASGTSQRSRTRWFRTGAASAGTCGSTRRSPISIRGPPSVPGRRCNLGLGSFS